MQSPIRTEELRELPPRLRARLAPLDKLALGVAFGALGGGLVFLLSAYHLVFDGLLMERVPYLVARGGDYSGDHLWLLEAYFRGYSPEAWSGASIGALWGAWTGFVLGWFLAFARNFTVATWLFVVRTRERLHANRSFLDQI